MKNTDQHMDTKRYQHIDVLRGLAAILVILQHSSESFIKNKMIADNGQLIAEIIKSIDFGRIGIVCFFLISGFVIPSSFQTQSNKPLKTFAIRRFFRLYPAYWLSLLCIILYQIYLGRPPEAKTVIANTTMIQSFFFEPHLIGLYWTLQIELIFYVLCMILFYVNYLNHSKMIFLMALIFFGVFTLIQVLSLFVSPQIPFLSKELQLMPYMLSIMFLGALYRKVYDQKKQKPAYRYTIVASIVCWGLPLMLLIFSIFGIELVKDSFRFGISHCLGFLIFIAGVKWIKQPYKIFLWLGSISYSLYLFHAQILQILVRIINNTKISLIQGLHLTFYMALTIIISIILASIIYLTIEKKSIKIGKRLTK